MPPKNDACYDDLLFHRFLEEQIGGQQEAEIAEHIGRCAKCQRALESMAGQDEDWHELKADLAEHQPTLELEANLEEVRSESGSDVSGITKLLGPTDDPTKLGRLGGYEICGVIGRGSAGIVFKALDKRLDRMVAIKILAPGYSSNGSSRKRFEREGRSIAAVRDAHVIPIYGVDEFQGIPFIVMQYMPAGSLHQRLEKQGPLTTKEVVRIGMQIASGLAAAHRQGIIHRDVKPGNVLLEDGIERALVTDFGLARVADEATMTHSGAISGTPQFMSPEQANGAPLDPRSDLFSLGSVMYTACTGHSPFRSETVFGVIKRVCESEPRPIREIQPEIEAWLAAFIRKLQAKRPEDRFESAGEVADLLAQELAHLQSPAVIPRPARTWMKPECEAADRKKRRLSGRAVATLMAVAVIGGSLAWMNNGGMSGGGGQVSGTQVNSGDEGNAGGQVGSGTFVKSVSKFDHVVSHTFDVQPQATLHLRTNRGKLNVTTHRGKQVTLRIAYAVSTHDQQTANKMFAEAKLDFNSDPKLKELGLVEGRDALALITLPDQHAPAHSKSKPVKGTAQASIEIQVPEKFNVDLQTGDGPIQLVDLEGTATLLAKNGKIVAGNMGGDVRFTTLRGSIHAGDLAGNATLRTAGDPIEVGFVSGDLSASTSGGIIRAVGIRGATVASADTGNIQLHSVEGPATLDTTSGEILVRNALEQVHAESKAGSIHVNFANQPLSDSKLFSIAGPITVGLLKDLDINIDAATQVGRVRGPFISRKTAAVQKHLNPDRQSENSTSLMIRSQVGSIDFSYCASRDIELTDKVRENPGAQAWFDRAYRFHMAGEFDESIKAHTRAAEFPQFRGIGTYNAACGLAAKGQTDKAIALLHKAVEYGFDDLAQYRHDEDLADLQDDPRFLEILARIKGRTAAEHLVDNAMNHFYAKEYEAAEKLYRQILIDNPDDEHAALHLGVTLHHLGKLEEAMQFHERAAKSDEYVALGNYNIACVNAIRGNTDQALDALEKSIEAGFSNRSHFQSDSDLDPLRSHPRFIELMLRAEGHGEHEEHGECAEESHGEDIEPADPYHVD